MSFSVILDEILYYVTEKNQYRLVCRSPAHRIAALHTCHVKDGVHIDASLTLDALAKHYYWISMTKDTEIFVSITVDARLDLRV